VKFSRLPGNKLEIQDYRIGKAEASEPETCKIKEQRGGSREMKKILFLFGYLLLLLGVAVSAWATPVSYVGGHMTFTFYEGGNKNALWGTNIDVINVWEVDQFMEKGRNNIRFRSVFTSLDVGPDYDGIPGVPMQDGPFHRFLCQLRFFPCEGQ